MEKNKPGYPLPAGELGEDEIVCQLVYLPDRPEYWQALLAGVHYFSTWRAWERDDDKRGKDAAANWREAFELTMECWRMTCLEDITDRMDEIIYLMGLKKDCCDDNITYDQVPEITTDIVPEVGDPPEFYGETEVADWEEWLEHVCYHAHMYVDALKKTASDMDTLTDTKAWTLGFIGAGLVLLTFVGLPLAIGYALVAATAAGLIAAIAEGIFSDTEATIEAARIDIVCSLMQGTSLADAVESALSSGLDWDLFFQWVPYETAQAIIYEGGHGGVYLETEKKDDCIDCDLNMLSDEDVVVNITLGTYIDYDEPTRVWTVRSQDWSNCHHIDIMFWTDMSMTVRMPVIIEVLTCDGTGDCSGIANYRGFNYPGPALEWSVTEPDLPDTGQSEIEYFVALHWPVQYDITFRLFENP